MKTYQILLLDSITKEIEKIENFKCSSINLLKERLKELQEGYCEGEKPVVFMREYMSNGLKINVAIAESDCDFCYMAAIGKV